MVNRTKPGRPKAGSKPKPAPLDVRDLRDEARLPPGIEREEWLRMSPASRKKSWQVSAMVHTPPPVPQKVDYPEGPDGKNLPEVIRPPIMAHVSDDVEDMQDVNNAPLVGRAYETAFETLNGTRDDIFSQAVTLTMIKSALKRPPSASAASAANARRRYRDLEELKKRVQGIPDAEFRELQ